MVKEVMKMLLADGNQTVRDALRIFVAQKLKCSDIVEARTSEEFASAAEQIMPDLVMVDWQLGMSSLRPIFGKLRKRNPSVRFVVLSAEADVQQAALESGCDYFVHKGGTPEQFLSVLDGVTIPRNKHDGSL